MQDNKHQDKKSVMNREEFGGKFKYVSFDPQKEQFLCVTTLGVHIFNINPFSHHIARALPEVDFAEISHFKDLIGYVTNNKFVYYNIKKKDSLGEIPEMNTIYGIRFTKDYLVLIFEYEINVYKIDHMERKFMTIETAKVVDGRGICECSIEENIVCVPSPTLGHIRVVFLEERDTFDISAHRNHIKCLSLNRDGSFVASSSSQGTLIRIFQTMSGEKIREVRRGSTQADMYSICFSDDSKDLCCYSSRGTIHIFGLSTNEGKNRTSSLAVLGYMGLSVLSSEWSKGVFKVFFDGNDYGICCFDSSSFSNNNSSSSNNNNNDCVVVLSEEGTFSKVIFDFEKQTSKVMLEEDVFNSLVSPVEDRKKKMEKLKKANPNQIAILLDFLDKEEANQYFLKKKKFLATKNLSLAVFEKMINMRIQSRPLSKEDENKNNNNNSFERIKFFAGENQSELQALGSTLEEIYTQFKSEDGFLYLKIKLSK